MRCDAAQSDNSKTRNKYTRDEMDELEPAKEDRCSFRSWSSSYIADDDWNQPDTRDPLDLERMAEMRAENQLAKKARYIDQSEMDKYIQLHEADFEDIKRRDKLLERAYDLYLMPAFDAVPEVKRKTEDQIVRLESEPHFYCPYEREETTEAHVTRWLEEYTSQPEIELLGFTCEPKRFLAATQPRASTSDTNVILGKRKRCRYEEGVEVSRSSSEARLVYKSGCRPRKARRRR